MIHIAYIVSTLRKCGPTNQLYYIISNIDADRFKAHIITLSAEPEDTSIEKFRNLPLKILSLRLSRLKGFLFGIKYLKKLLNDIKPDIIHTQGLRADMMGNKIKNIHVISTVRNIPYIDYPMKYGRVIGRWMSINQMRVIRSNNNSFACSSRLSNELYDKFNIKIPYIQNGVDTTLYHPVNNDEKMQIRNSLGINENNLVFITTGNLIPRKDHVTMIKGFLNSQTNGSLVILGSGPEEYNIRKYMHITNKMKIIGHTDKVDKYLKASDYFISTSLSEGLPNTVMEAMSTGLPVILTDIPSHKEIFEELKYKYLFPPKNDKQLTELIKDIIASDNKNIRSMMREIITTKFSAEAMSEKYQKVYEKISG